ncbi:hypothetical protein [Haloactinopolyspora sp.]|uniref:LVIVD repeat-containing protein n=1 Tax=Haloactinopolyspora sp. TaxID=1966353 RepID=UPI002616E6A7|nr:hypothetical protein [Haloactinopolyspora sp.]
MQFPQRSGRSWFGSKVTALTGALVVAAVGLAGPSAAQYDELEPDEIAHSDNISHVANIPQQGVNEGFTHSDLAFWGDYAIQGSYGGINIYDIKNPRKTELVSQFSCPGGQGDPTVSPDGSLVFMSVDSARTDDSCQSEGSSPADPDAWEGMRIIDITDIENPEYVGSVQTDCGSHTHTLVPDDSGEVVYLYVSSYGPADAFPNCQPPHDSISIVEVPLDNPSEAAVIAKPNLFPDGGAPGTAGCHDITVFPEEDLAAGACMGEGILMDVSDPADPYVITTVRDANFAFWHSATFTNDAKRVVFTDELGGGGAATCNEEIGPERGANAIFDIVGQGDDRTLEFRSYFKIPRHQQDTENCVAHNGSLIPVKHGDIMVQAWYQGGVSVYDFTDPDNPVEIAYFERGPLDPPGLGGSWSAYWYNGYIYSSDIAKGLDVLKVRGREFAGANRIRMDHFNAQTQPRYRD